MNGVDFMVGAQPGHPRRARGRAKLPWASINCAELAADVGELRDREALAVLRLVLHQGRYGFLPREDDRLARICRVSLRAWRERIWPFVMHLFEWVDEVNGYVWAQLWEQRNELLARSAERSERMSEIGRKGAAARWRPESASDEAPAPRSHAIDEAMPPMPCGTDNAWRGDGHLDLDSDSEKEDSALRAAAGPGPAEGEVERELLVSPVEARMPADRSDGSARMAHAMPSVQTVRLKPQQSQAVDNLRALTGRTQKSAQSFLGKLVMEADRDFERVTDAIGRALADPPAGDRSAWLMRAVKPPATARPHESGAQSTPRQTVNGQTWTMWEAMKRQRAGRQAAGEGPVIDGASEPAAALASAGDEAASEDGPDV